MHLGTKTEVAKRVVHAEVVAQRADRFSGPVPITAADALSADIDRSNGLILYYEASLSQNEDHVVRTMLNAERGHQHKLTTTALAQKADERRVVLYRSAVDALAEIIRHIVTDLGHDPDSDRVRLLMADAVARVVVTPDDPYAVVAADVVEPWEAAAEEWERHKYGDGPIGYGDDF